jgi:hypothetical protein
MTKRQWIELSIPNRRIVLSDIMDTAGNGYENEEWDILPYWLRRHLAHFK